MNGQTMELHADHVNLHELARRVMLERGLEPEFPPEVLRQVASLSEPARDGDGAVRDLRGLAWCSIDNDDSRDLDQLTVAQDLGGGDVRVLVAVADVDALVRPGSAVDDHARTNTTSVYTAGGIFPMLPEKLSTDLTSLNEGEDRLAIIVAYVVRTDGSVSEGEVYRAWVRNKAKLAYNSVAAWLDGSGPIPPALAAAAGVPEQLRLQDAVAQRLAERRHEHGALTLETIEAKVVADEGRVVDLQVEPKNRAHEIIEDFMIAANGVTTRYLAERNFPTFRRVVRTPERWDRIRHLASEFGEALPPEPNAPALERFLSARRQADPLRFPDLSLAVIKLLGPGEYMVNVPGQPGMGHFGLAVRDYSHSTAPNRRYPDIITQRLLKAAMAGSQVPYALTDLEDLAAHCTRQEDAAKKVERQVSKSAAAALLSDRIGEHFDALVTGVTSRGTWVRVLHPPVEGMLVQGAQGADVGDRIHVRLVAVDIERGYIDFARAKP
ncbi:MAG: RNB domain-containing ribonuclease [Chthonomonadales bacterium]